MQDREEERKERQDMMQLIIDLRDEIKLIVIISFNRTLLIMLNLINHCPWLVTHCRPLLFNRTPFLSVIFTNWSQRLVRQINIFFSVWPAADYSIIPFFSFNIFRILATRWNLCPSVTFFRWPAKKPYMRLWIIQTGNMKRVEMGSMNIFSWSGQKLQKHLRMPFWHSCSPKNTNILTIGQASCKYSFFLIETNMKNNFK